MTATTTESTPTILVECQSCCKTILLAVNEIGDADCLRLTLDNWASSHDCTGAGEWLIIDSYGFGSLQVENLGLDEIIYHAEAIAQHGAEYAAYAAHVGERYANVEDFEDAFCGEFDSEREYADDLVEECWLCDATDFVRMYFDYEAFCRDLFISDNYSIPTDRGTVFVFRNC